MGSIFNGNVRDWQEYTTVNKDIQKTLAGQAERSRFVLMNNGITIIARTIRQANHRFTIENFQIVNGCQTSHVVFNERGLDDSVCIPLRLIETRNEDVIESIIHATNNQSPLKPEQLYALMTFSKKLEAYFQAHEMPHTLYYERRDGQYDRMAIEKTRIVVPANVIRAFAAMFLDEPTRATRNYKLIRDWVGDKIFKEGDRLEPYYVAAFAAYRLEFLFRNLKLDSDYKAARYHILMTLRYRINAAGLPHMNSYEMERRCQEMTDLLWDTAKADTFLTEAAAIVREVVGEPFDRDHIRTEPVKEALLARFVAGGHP